MPDQAALALALIENIQREDLNPIETAAAFERMARELNLSHEQIGERTVSRITEMCGDPLLLKGTDQRVSMPDPFASDTPLPYGEPRARRLAS